LGIYLSGLYLFLRLYLYCLAAYSDGLLRTLHLKNCLETYFGLRRLRLFLKVDRPSGEGHPAAQHGCDFAAQGCWDFALATALVGTWVEALKE
jgi:hypothetical protein